MDTIIIPGDLEKSQIARKTRWMTARSTPRLWWSVPFSLLVLWFCINALMMLSAASCAHCTAPKWFLETFVSWPLRLLTGGI